MAFRAPKAGATIGLVLLLLIIATPGALALDDHAGALILPEGDPTPLPWWVYPILLFATTLVLGIIAVMGGVGGGVLFVPIVSGFFPFHLDFVRCAGLLIALTGSLSAAPGLLRKGLASFRLALPAALLASTASIGGAMLGLALPTDVVQIALGAAILGIAILIVAASNRSEYPSVPVADKLSSALRISGVYTEESSGQEINWKVHRTVPGFLIFLLIGVVAGMFGLGAGWANIPVLNLVISAPLKISVATSSFLLSITDTTAAWVYVNQGALLPILVVPSLVGMIVGARIGGLLLPKVKPSIVRIAVIGLLVLAGLRSLLKGLGI
jgi:hypothetical protein